MQHVMNVKAAFIREHQQYNSADDNARRATRLLRNFDSRCDYIHSLIVLGNELRDIDINVPTIASS